MDIGIYVAAHKPFTMPTEDPIYIPLGVGGINEKLPEGWEGDRGSDSISEKNSRYNELTGLYHIWKYAKQDIIGLCHYRRFFTTPAGKIRNILLGNQDRLIGKNDIEKMLKDHDMVLHNRTLFLKTNRQQVENREKSRADDKLDPEMLDIAEDVFCDLYPTDTDVYKRVLYGKHAHLLNMLIAKKELVDQYCEWLFPLLFNIEDRLDGTYPNDPLMRVMGLLGERLLDVWVLKEKLRIRECFVINTERRALSFIAK